MMALVTTRAVVVAGAAMSGVLEEPELKQLPLGASRYFLPAAHEVEARQIGSGAFVAVQCKCELIGMDGEGASTALVVGDAIFLENLRQPNHLLRCR